MNLDGQLDLNDLRPQALGVDEIERQRLAAERDRRRAWALVVSGYEEALAIAPRGDQARLRRCLERACELAGLPLPSQLQAPRLDRAAAS